jgi:membrane-bound lytic murein transglycosylase F
LLKNRQGELIGANLTRTSEREQQFNFGPDYAETKTIVVYRRGQSRPRELQDLLGIRLSVIAGSSYEGQLQRAKETLPELEWTAEKGMGMEDLLLAIADGELDATLVDSNIFKINSQFYPRLRAGFTLAEHQHQAWAFLPGDDDSLVQKARSFFKLINENGNLLAIQDSYKENGNDLDRVGMFQFMKQVRNRLPPLIPIFQEVATAHDIDWRLLAAMGYQESHWDPDAASKTGVRGIMMLTQPVAKSLGVTSRLDAKQNIFAGAKYHAKMKKMFDENVTEPDRSWMALAAYNVGRGHFRDAQGLAEKLGKNPNLWIDMKEVLPLLSEKEYYKDLTYGYARGNEPVQYVTRIRDYDDILVQYFTEKASSKENSTE